jgi:hypothetical protein
LFCQAFVAPGLKGASAMAALIGHPPILQDWTELADLFAGKINTRARKLRKTWPVFTLFYRHR